ncbi:MAG: response regulator [Anaerolineales bacterium]
MARILFVDDDPFTLETLTKAVEVFGHHALLADNGEAGLRLAETQSPDIIFTDMRLPDMDGLTFVEKLQKQPQTAQIPVLVLSASPSLDAVEMAKAAGAKEYINKPIRLQALLDIIQKYTSA